MSWTTPKTRKNWPKLFLRIGAFFIHGSASDPREAPLVQEVITYLGSFIRSSPAMFVGIMRIRTHFFVIAMREEISRMMRCDEVDAIEHLMEVGAD